MKKLLMFGLAAGVTALAASAFAGDDTHATKPEMFAIYKDVVIPAKTKEYEAGVKYMIGEFEAYGIDPEKIHWKTVSGPELGYVYVMPIEDFAGMDKMHADWEAAMEIIGKEKFEDIMDAVADSMDHVEAFQVVRRDDLSYAPDEPALDPEEVAYVHYSFYYALPGKSDVIEAAAKEYAALYKAKGAKYGWSVYEAVTGTDLPVFVVAHPAKTQGDFYRHKEELKTLIGEDAEAIGAKVMTAIRKVDHKDGWLRPELSYPQQDTKKAAHGTR